MAKLNTLVDDFSGGSIDTGLWAPTGAVSQSGGKAILTPGTTFALFPTVPDYDGVEAEVVVQVANWTATGTTTSLDSGIVVAKDVDNLIAIHKLANEMRVTKKVAGTESLQALATYSAGPWAWLRMRSVSNTFFCERSSDGISWVLFTTIDIAVSLFDLSVVFFYAFSGWSIGTESSPGTFQLDAVNPPTSKSASDTATASDTAGTVSSSRSAAETASGVDAFSALSTSRTATETATVTQNFSALSTSRSATDAALVTDAVSVLAATTPKSASDAITLGWAESVSLSLTPAGVITAEAHVTDTAGVIALAASDVASVLDTASAQSRAASDAVSVLDAGAPATAALATTDAASVSDAEASLVVDTGGPVDVVAAETLTVIDAESVQAEANDSDSFAASDLAALIAQTSTESVSAIDDGGVDTGMAVPVAASESMTITDTAAPLELADLDLATGLDQFPVVGFDASDSASIVDSGSLVSAPSDAETAQLIDGVGSLVVLITDTDGAVVTDAGQVAAALVASENATAVDEPLASVAAVSADDAMAVSIDNGPNVVGLGASESVVASDAPLLTVARISTSDLATMAETAALTAFLVASDAVVVVDDGRRTLDPASVSLRSIVGAPTLASSVPGPVRFVVVETLTALVVDQV